jgi:hypothetical protein
VIVNLDGILLSFVDKFLKSRVKSVQSSTLCSSTKERAVFCPECLVLFREIQRLSSIWLEVKIHFLRNVVPKIHSRVRDSSAQFQGMLAQKCVKVEKLPQNETVGVVPSRDNFNPSDSLSSTSLASCSFNFSPLGLELRHSFQNFKGASKSLEVQKGPGESSRVIASIFF